MIVANSKPKAGFMQAAAKHFAGSARSSLSAAIRAAFGPELQQLELDWVKQLRPGLQLCFRGFTLGSRDRLTQLCSALEVSPSSGKIVAHLWLVAHLWFWGLGDKGIA